MEGDAGIPIGPIIGAAVGLGILAATVKITKDAFDRSKESEQARPHPIYRQHPINRPHPTAKPIETKNTEGFDIDARINRMLGRTK